MNVHVELVELGLDEIGEHFGRYPLHAPEAERAMARSLRRYGQIARSWSPGVRSGTS
jgi:hypothetical protein